MKAVILAAGMGTRIKTITRTMPKILTKLGNNSILDFQLKSLRFAGIEEVVIVVGYMKEKIYNYLENIKYHIPNVKYVFNSCFAETNNAYSLYLALKSMQTKLDNEIVLVLDGDIIFDPKILMELVPYENACICDGSRFPLEEDAKVLIDETGLVKGVGKEFESRWIYTSIMKMGGKLLKEFYDELSKAEYKNVWYSIPLTKLLNTSKSAKIRAVCTTSMVECELDTEEDLVIMKDFYTKLVKKYPFIEEARGE
jgi:choline kinase